MRIRLFDEYTKKCLSEQATREDISMTRLVNRILKEHYAKKDESVDGGS